MEQMTDMNDTTLPYRAVSALKRAGIDTLEEVADISDAELLQIRNIGVKSLSEIRMAVPFKRPDGQSLTMDTPIEDVILSIRAFNCLKRAGVNTVGDLYAKSDKELRRMRGVGVGVLAEIVNRFPNRTRTKPTDGIKDVERFNAIIQMRLEGATLEEIGKKHGLTRERVRQICERAGVRRNVQYTLDGSL